jgi:hypothetical protein
MSKKKPESSGKFRKTGQFCRGKNSLAPHNLSNPGGKAA